MHLPSTELMFGKKVTLGKCVLGAKLGFSESLKHTLGWNTMLCAKNRFQWGESSQPQTCPSSFVLLVPSNKLVSVWHLWKSAKFGRYRFIEIHRVLAAGKDIEHVNITNGTWVQVKCQPSWTWVKCQPWHRWSESSCWQLGPWSTHIESWSSYNPFCSASP